MLLVDRCGAILLQHRDDGASVAPNQWGLVGGHLEPGEQPESGARRELAEETGLGVAGPLRLVYHETFAAEADHPLREYWIYCAPTTATDADVVLGEGQAIVFVPPDEIVRLDLGPSARWALSRFLESPEYDDCLRAHGER